MPIRVLHCLARRLRSLGFEVHIVVLEYLGQFAEELEDAVTFHQVPRSSRLSFLHPARLSETLRRIRLIDGINLTETNILLKTSKISAAL